MRVDEFAINEKGRRLGHNEMTLGWDRKADFYETKDSFKTAWYQPGPWIAHLIRHLQTKGWVVHQVQLHGRGERDDTRESVGHSA
eukprot:3477454-Rhodomonas_salina.1